jgi:hypothetical protein
LPEQANDTADRQHEADLDLRPLLRGQIDRNERTEAGLNVGEKEDEPVEATLAFARRLLLAARRGRQRHDIALPGGSPVATVINPIERWGWTGDQAAAPHF